jgi:hypothetical protein
MLWLQLWGLLTVEVRRILQFLNIPYFLLFIQHMEDWEYTSSRYSRHYRVGNLDN